MRWSIQYDTNPSNVIPLFDNYGGDLFLRQFMSKILVEAIEAWLVADWQ